MTNPPPFDPGHAATVMLERAIQTIHRRRRRHPDDAGHERDLLVYEYVLRAVMEKRGREIDLTAVDVSELET